MLIQFKVLIAALLFLTLSLGTAAATEPSPPDLSFTEEEANSPGFVRPPLQPEHIGDMDYLRSLPRARDEPYVIEDDLATTRCTNDLAPVRLSFRDDVATRDFAVPRAYLWREPKYLSANGNWPSPYDVAASQIHVRVSLPDFRPLCLVDEAAPQNMSGERLRELVLGISRSALRVSFSPNTASQSNFNSEQFKLLSFLDTPIEQVFPGDYMAGMPGMSAYVRRPSSSRYYLPAEMVVIIPKDSYWSDRIYATCSAVRITQNDWLSCYFRYRAEDSIFIEFSGKYYAGEWRQLAESLSKLVNSWVVPPQ